MWLNRAAAIVGILTAVVVLAQAPAKKRQDQKQQQQEQTAKDQQKLDKIPVCPKGCVPGRKLGLKEQLLSSCPDGCRPGSVE